jgi:hypothetical protein
LQVVSLKFDESAIITPVLLHFNIKHNKKFLPALYRNNKILVNDKTFETYIKQFKRDFCIRYAQCEKGHVNFDMLHDIFEYELTFMLLEWQRQKKIKLDPSWFKYSK